MFGSNFFGNAFYGHAYFGEGGTGIPPVVPTTPRVTLHVPRRKNSMVVSSNKIRRS